MRSLLLALALLPGCRQLFGLDDPPPRPDAPTVDAPPADAGVDACSDVDHDGVCDVADDWPCGPKPTAPAAQVTFTATKLVVSLTAITITGGPLLVVAPDTDVEYGFSFQIVDTRCNNGCQDQIEVGLVPGPRLACPVDAHVPNGNAGLSSSVTDQKVKTPATPGEYDLRFDLGSNLSCGANGVTSWWPDGTPPDPTQVLAHICVH